MGISMSQPVVGMVARFDDHKQLHEATERNSFSNFSTIVPVAKSSITSDFTNIGWLSYEMQGCLEHKAVKSSKIVQQFECPCLYSALLASVSDYPCDNH